MEHIGKGWGVHLVGGYLCAQTYYLFYLYLLSLSRYLIFMFSTSNIIGKPLNKQNQNHMIILPQNVWCKYQTRFMYNNNV